MSKQIPIVDPEGLLEYSVVFNDRSLNHMSKEFQGVMNDISSTLKVSITRMPPSWCPEAAVMAWRRWRASSPMASPAWWCAMAGSAIAGARFSMPEGSRRKPRSTRRDRFRRAASSRSARRRLKRWWSRSVRRSRALCSHPMWRPPRVCCCPTITWKQVADATHEVGGLFVLDCVASGALWVDMKAVGADVLISAPQKGWSASPCAALVMLSQRGLERLEATTSSSFACDLKKWHGIMQAYEGGGHAYHATMPTDALAQFRDAMLETVNDGLGENPRTSTGTRASRTGHVR